METQTSADLLARRDLCLVHFVRTYGYLSLVLVGRCTRSSTDFGLLSLVGMLLPWLANREISRILPERRATGLVELGKGAFQNARQATVPSGHVREGI